MSKWGRANKYTVKISPSWNFFIHLCICSWNNSTIATSYNSIELHPSVCVEAFQPSRSSDQEWARPAGAPVLAIEPSCCDFVSILDSWLWRLSWQRTRGPHTASKGDFLLSLCSCMWNSFHLVFKKKAVLTLRRASCWSPFPLSLVRKKVFKLLHHISVKARVDGSHGSPPCCCSSPTAWLVRPRVGV